MHGRPRESNPHRQAAHLGILRGALTTERQTGPDPAPAAYQQLRSIRSSASAYKQHPINNSVGGASSTKDRQKQPAHHLESEGYPGVSKQYMGRYQFSCCLLKSTEEALN